MFDYPDNTVAVFDLDGTLTHRDTYLGILLHSLRRNPATAPGLARLAWPVVGFRLGRIDNTQLKTKFLRVLLAPLTADRLEDVVESFLERLFATGFRAEGLDMLNRHRAAGHVTVLLTASPDFYVEEISRRLELDHCICTGTVRRADNSLSGELATANCRGREKVTRIKRHFGDAFSGCHFVGYADQESDLPLLEAMHTGVMVNAKPSVRVQAEQSGLQLAEWR